MRYFAIGDIHGCSHALNVLLAIINPKPNDIIITLGDYINKGPDSRGVIERLIQISKTHKLIALKGNHELLLIRNRFHPLEYLIKNQLIGSETLLSYKQQEFSLSNIPENHWHFLSHTCLDSWENETHIFVHANLDPCLPLNQQPEEQLFWEKFISPSPHYSGKTMICGHTCQKSGKPVNLGYAICLDTWACGEGWLSCLDIYGGQIWQVNQQGQIKTANIKDFTVPSTIFCNHIS